MRRSFLLLPVLGAMWLYACADTSNDSGLDDPPETGGSGVAGSSAGKGGAGGGGKSGQGGAGQGGAGDAGTAGSGAGTAGSAGAAAGTGGASAGTAGAGGASPEDTDALCSDGKDNDDNGYADCGDINCVDNPNVTVCGQGGAGGGEPFGGSGGTGSGESTAALCSDGKDNDGNSYIDCEDKGCCAVIDCKTLFPKSYCAKQGAGGSSGGKEDTAALCSDGKDNDGDSFKDCNDYDCCDVVDCKATAPTSSCAKQGSGGSGGSGGSSTGKEDTAALCSDGKDNDGDSFKDCNDYDCCDVVDCKATAPTSDCAKQGSGGSGGSSSGKENTAALCSDGKDNDGDSFKDCEDFDCCSLIDCKTLFPKSACAKK